MPTNKIKMASIPEAELAMLRAESAEGRMTRLILLDIFRRHGGPVSFTIQMADFIAAEAERSARLHGMLREAKAADC